MQTGENRRVCCYGGVQSAVGGQSFRLSLRERTGWKRVCSFFFFFIFSGSSDGFLSSGFTMEGLKLEGNSPERMNWLMIDVKQGNKSSRH